MSELKIKKKNIVACVLSFKGKKMKKMDLRLQPPSLTQTNLV